MLQKLNERIQGVVAWVIISLVAVTFTLFGIDYYMQSRHESEAQIEVNGEPITRDAFEANYRRTRQLRDPSQMTVASENQLKQQVIDEMIINTISMQAASNNGFSVSASQANAAILNIPQFQQDGHFSADRYQQALSGALFTPESFQKEVRQGMLLNQQRFAFVGTSFALPNEISQFVKLYMQTRDYEYIQIPALRFISHVNVSDKEAEDYYQLHQKDFYTPEKVSVDFIRLSISDIKEKIKISEQQIKRYYDENQSNYYTPAQWQVAHILFAISPDMPAEEQLQIKTLAEERYRALQKNPNQFGKEVVRLSDDKISAAHGGVLPWIVAGQSEFDKALVDLTMPGQISAPFKSQHGYEIFKLISYKPAVIRPLSEVKADIHAQLVTDLAQAAYAQALERLSDLSYQTPDSLGPVADVLHLTIQQSTPFSRQGGDSEMTKNKQVISAAFSHDVMALGNNSEPIQLNNDSVVVLRVNKHIPEEAKTFAEVKPLIIEKLTRNKAKQEARSLGRALLNAASNPSKHDELMQKNQLQWKSAIAVGRDSDFASVAINEMAFTLPRVGSAVGRSLVGGDYVIVHLKKINDGQSSILDKEQEASITQQIEANYGMMDYDLYMRYLLKHAKVVRH